jgi:hypothetical protein
MLLLRSRKKSKRRPELSTAPALPFALIHRSAWKGYCSRPHTVHPKGPFSATLGEEPEIEVTLV